MKITIKKLKLILYSTAAIMGFVIIALSFALYKQGTNNFELDKVRAAEEIKNVVSSKLSKAVIPFSDICFALYSGTIGDVRTTELNFGKKCSHISDIKAKRCISYAMKTDHNLFSVVRADVMSDISRSCMCFVKPREAQKIINYADNMVVELLRDEETMDVATGSVVKMLRRRIEGSERQQLKADSVKINEKEKDDDDCSWEQTAADIASFVSKAAVKAFF